MFFPLRSDELLSRFRVKQVLAGFGAWDLSLQYFADDLRVVSSFYDQPVSQHAGDAVSVLIPATIQLTLMAAVTGGVERMFPIEPSSNQRAVSFEEKKAKSSSFSPHPAFHACHDVPRPFC